MKTSPMGWAVLATPAHPGEKEEAAGKHREHR